MAAAARAAENGAHVALVDDNPRLGGQIWRTSSTESSSEERPWPTASAKWQARVQAVKVETFSGMRVFHQPEPGVLHAESADSLHEYRYEKLILATGARERFLPFPGWTLPNVMGAGGLQALVKSGLPIEGKRVVIAGTGPLLLAVAAYLRQHGAKIPQICEQASWSNLASFGLSLLKQPGKIIQGLQLRKEISGARFSANSWPLTANGRDKLESVTILRNGKSETIPCDYLACGFHLVPNLELPLLLGCQIQCGTVQVDDLQRTTVQNIYCAGEPTGIGGVELALAEGEVAGLAAANRTDDATKLFPQRDKLRAFVRVLDKTFRLRRELKNLATPETLVCRCEDVSLARLRRHTSWREAKLQTRCGMGPCQGRICGPATQFLLKWNPESVRPPIYPSRLESLAGVATPEPEYSEITGGLK